MFIRKEELKDYPTDKFDIKPSFDVPRENFMVYKIKENASDIHGIVKYAKEFGIT